MTNLNVTNLFENLPDSMPEELVDSLVENQNVRIERIVSTGQASQPKFWYDQNENEWVVVLKGHAKLRFAGDAKLFEMRPGDHVLIPAHRKHRVEWTTPDEPTVWLALFYSGESRQR